MKIIIVENERPASEKLLWLINEIQPETEVLTVLETVEDSVNWFKSNPKPDLVFMDIQLDDGISFEIFDAVKIEAPVIFTTAFDEYAIRAFKVNSVDYLLKPIDKDSLNAAFAKFDKLYNDKGAFETKLAKVFEQISVKYKSRFFIKIGVRFQSIPVEEICCFFVEERNSFIRTTKGKTYDLDFSLDQVQKKVDPEMFFRINRNFIINLNCIIEILSYSTNRLKIKLEHCESNDLIVSRDKVSEFKSWMDR